MNKHLPDVGNVGITSSGVTAVATVGGGAVGWINENAMLIGIGISVTSLIVGVVFKMLGAARAERHHKERMFEEAQQNAKALNILRAEIRAELRGESDSNVTSHKTHTDDNRE
tara:strand:- start:3298 stop:3636 length:339 start_codon:yes stop_codon:yes gene_type:complete